MSRVDTVQNNAAVTPSLMKNVLPSAAGVAPPSCPNTPAFHSAFLLFPQSDHKVHKYLHTWRILSSPDSHFIPAFLNFIARKGVSLIMVIERTITGVEFPLCAPLASNSVSAAERASGFQLHSQKWSPIAAPCHRWWDVCAGAKTWCSV